MNVIRVLIVDDHFVVREGLKHLLEAEPDIEVVGEAPNGHEAIRRALELTPDVVILDVEMPGTNGIEVARALSREQPAIRLLALTMHERPQYLGDFLAAGGRGYVVKDALGLELLAALRAVHQGRVHINAAVSTDTARESLEDIGPTVEPNAELMLLSTREREVLALVARGFTSREIGKRLGLSPKTISTYRARISEKLGFSSRADYVEYALARGLFERG